MIFSTVSRVQERGFELDPADLQRIGVFDQSLCWGVWVPDPRGELDRRKHLLISPIHPSVWPFLLRMEIMLRDAPGTMAAAMKSLVNSKINVQFTECGKSGHHHATWNVVADANDVRSELNEDFINIQRLPDNMRGPENPQLREFSNTLATLMLAKALALPKTMEDEHANIRGGNFDSGFLHNRIVNRVEFFFEPSEMPTGMLVDAAKEGLPQAVTCRWMQNLAFFAIYGDMHNPMRLQYQHSTRLLKPVDHSSLRDILEEQEQPTSLPAGCVASFDTSGLYLRIDIIDPVEARSKFFQASIDYKIRFVSNSTPGQSDTTRGLLLSVCKQIAKHEIDLVQISNRTTHRDPP